MPGAVDFQHRSLHEALMERHVVEIRGDLHLPAFLGRGESGGIPHHPAIHGDGTDIGKARDQMAAEFGFMRQPGDRPQSVIGGPRILGEAGAGRLQPGDHSSMTGRALGVWAPARCQRNSSVLAFSVIG